jgi:predicted phosphodiesterase
MACEQLKGINVIASDVHGEFDRFQRFCRLIQDIDPKKVYLLGDILQIGKSSDDNLCMQLALDKGFNRVSGNHESLATLRAMTLKAFQRKRGLHDIDQQMFEENMGRILELPLELRRGIYLFTHTLPKNKKVTTLDDAREVFDYLDEHNLNTVFIGHFHEPRSFYYEPRRRIYGEEKEETFELGSERKYVINPGSLGARAIGSYILFDADKRLVQRKKIE